MAAIEIHQFPCLQDNYGFLLHDPESGLTATIDTPDAAAILAEANRRGWGLTHIFNTHHHWDHAGGNLELKKQTGCIIVGPRADAARIPGIDLMYGEGDEFLFGGHRVQVFDTPGHTRGHIVYYLPDDDVAFVGDTLFAMGCGRLFEGTAEQMWSSLQKLLRWPDETHVYCAHEYTQANARFALTVEPRNPDLIERAAEVDGLRARGMPTVPTRIGLERKTNPFLRPDSTEIQDTLGMRGAPLIEVFAETRRRKNGFRG
jgi:hydroxyacylglutathione hydrolase